MKRWSHNEISALYRKTLSRIIDVPEDALSPQQWDSFIYHFAQTWERISARYWFPITEQELEKEIIRDIAENL